jgi:hypothetical protein
MNTCKYVPKAGEILGRVCNCGHVVASHDADGCVLCKAKFYSEKPEIPAEDMLQLFRSHALQAAVVVCPSGQPGDNPETIRRRRHLVLLTADTFTEYILTGEHDA